MSEGGEGFEPAILMAPPFELFDEELMFSGDAMGAILEVAVFLLGPRANFRRRSKFRWPAVISWTARGLIQDRTYSGQVGRARARAGATASTQPGPGTSLRIAQVVRA